MGERLQQSRRLARRCRFQTPVPFGERPLELVTKALQLQETSGEFLELGRREPSNLPARKGAPLPGAEDAGKLFQREAHAHGASNQP